MLRWHALGTALCDCAHTGQVLRGHQSRTTAVSVRIRRSLIPAETTSLSLGHISHNVRSIRLLASNRRCGLRLPLGAPAGGSIAIVCFPLSVSGRVTCSINFVTRTSARVACTSRYSSKRSPSSTPTTRARRPAPIRPLYLSVRAPKRAESGDCVLRRTDGRTLWGGFRANRVRALAHSGALRRESCARLMCTPTPAASLTLQRIRLRLSSRMLLIPTLLRWWWGCRLPWTRAAWALNVLRRNRTLHGLSIAQPSST